MYKEEIRQKRMKRNTPPHNEMRKEIFRLEGKLSPPFTSKGEETVEAWLKRSNCEEGVLIQNSIMPHVIRMVKILYICMILRKKHINFIHFRKIGREEKTTQFNCAYQ